MTEITELSKETLGSYIKKSIPNIQHHNDEISRLHQKLASSGARPWSMSDHAKSIQKDIHKSQHEFKKRYAGLVSAVNKGDKAVSNKNDHENKDIHHDHDFRYNKDGTVIKPLKISHDLNNSPKTASGKRVLKRIYHYEGPRKEEHNLKSPSKSTITRNNGFIIHKNEHGEVISKKPIDNGIKHSPTVETKSSAPKTASRRSVDKEGNISHYNKAGKLHNSDGPAVEMKNGYKAWIHDGKYHREDGPAIIHANGTKHWYIHGKKQTIKEDTNMSTNIQELSKKTLGSYIRKNAANREDIGKAEIAVDNARNSLAQGSNNAYRGINDKERRTMNDMSWDIAKLKKSINKKRDNRDTGMWRATDKLTRESIESDIRLDDLHTMLNNMLDSQPSEFKNTFTDVLTNKISDKIETMKQNIAQSLFNNEVEEEQVEESEQIDKLTKEDVQN